MKILTYSIFFAIGLFVVRFLYSCNSFQLSEADKNLAKAMEFDEDVLKEIKPYFSNPPEAFHYSLGKALVDDKWIETDTIDAKGIAIYENPPKSSENVLLLKDRLREKGYTIFLMENNFGIEKRADLVGILKTTDKYEILKIIETNGINHDLENDSLIQIIKKLDSIYDLELIGAGGDWCEFIIHKEPSDYKKFAEEIYEICPDIVDQGTETVEALAEEMKRTKRLYFWWD
ncbi:MAG: DUF4253 domain-containing protein [Bacteroidia bacterium]